jgi:hypothetical protein
MPDLSQEQLDGLYNEGYINFDTYMRMTRPGSLVQPNPTLNMTPLPSSPEQAVRYQNSSPLADDAFKRSMNEWDRRDEQKALLNKHNQDIERNSQKTPMAPPAPVPAPPTNQALSSDQSAPNPQTLASPYNAAYDMQKNAITAGATASGQKNDAQSLLMQQSINEQNELERKRQEAEAERQAQLNTKIQDLEKSVSEVSSASVDPNKFWSEKSTGNQILTGIALALGAFGSTPDNKVVGLLNNLIDRDINLQKWNITNKRDNISAKTGLLGQMRLKFGDERQAEEATRMAAIQKVQNEIMQKSMQYASPEIKANADKLIGELELKKQEARQNFAAFASGDLVPKTFSDAMALKKDKSERTIAGVGMVNDARDAQKIRDAKAAFDTMKASVVQLKALAAKYSGITGSIEGAISTNDADRSRIIATDLMMNLNKLYENGVMNEHELEQYKKMIPNDVTAFWSKNNVQKLQQFLEIMTRKYEFLLRSRGIEDKMQTDKKR